MYLPNGATGGAPPANQTSPVGAPGTVSGRNTLSWPGYNFTGWNTAPNGNGTSYPPGTPTFMPQGGIVLYAQWVPLVPVPVAVDDAYVCQHDAPCAPAVSVLANDNSPNSGAVLNATLASPPPAGGNLTLNPDGTFVYESPL